MADEILGYCGLYCGGCGIYQATKAGKPLNDEAGKPLVCDGCNSGRLTPWCVDCAIKNCARAKNFRVCGDCPENPCEIITGFMNDPKYPYHLEVQDIMRYLKANGLKDWEKLRSERYKCPSCDSRFDWLATACKKCGKPVK